MLKGALPLLLVFIASVAARETGVSNGFKLPWAKRKPNGVTQTGSELVMGMYRPIPPLSTAALFKAYPRLAQAAVRLARMREQQVGPEGLLYVAQREMAATSPQDVNIRIIGASGMTTSILAILRHTGSMATGVLYIEDRGLEDGVDRLLSRVQEMSLYPPWGRYELSLIGGYVTGAKAMDDALFKRLMLAFSKQVVEVHLVQAAVGWQNTKWRFIKLPIIRGAAINIVSGEIFPARFPVKGPVLTLRNARVINGQDEVIDIYDSTKGLVTIGPFDYFQLANGDELLGMRDKDFVKAISTSPDAEGPEFVKEVRDALKFMKRYPAPRSSIFPNSQPLRFAHNRDTGAWVQKTDLEN